MTLVRLLVLSITLALPLISSGCFLRHTEKGVRLAARQMNLAGWYELTPKEPPEPPELLTQPVSDPDDEDEEEEREDAQEDWDNTQHEAYYDQFEKFPLDPQNPKCSRIRALAPTKGRPLYVLVHGIEGDGLEWKGVVESLRQSGIESALMYRWIKYEKVEFLTQHLADGLTRVAQCLEDTGTPILVMAHSAGGCLSSIALAQVKLEQAGDRPRLRLLTVASPLAGTGYRAGDPAFEGDDTGRFVFELGRNLQGGYPKPPPGTQVIHARTQFPGDHVMKPSVTGHQPNQRGVGVPGAKELDLPETVTHVGALDYVIPKVLSGELFN